MNGCLSYSFIPTKHNIYHAKKGRARFWTNRILKEDIWLIVLYQDIPDTCFLKSARFTSSLKVAIFSCKNCTILFDEIYGCLKILRGNIMTFKVKCEMLFEVKLLRIFFSKLLDKTGFCAQRIYIFIV